MVVIRWNELLRSLNPFHCSKKISTELGELNTILSYLETIENVNNANILTQLNAKLKYSRRWWRWRGEPAQELIESSPGSHKEIEMAIKNRLNSTTDDDDINP